MEKFKEKVFSAVITREGKVFVSYSPETGVASQGRTRNDAIRNLKEAVELYLEDDPIDSPESREVCEFVAKVKAHA